MNELLVTEMSSINQNTLDNKMLVHLFFNKTDYLPGLY